MTRRQDERGQVLLFALGFLTFVGVLAVAVAGYVTTSFRSSDDLRRVRSLEYAADGAVDTAITAVRGPADTPSIATCPPGPIRINEIDMRVDCTAPVPLPGNPLDVTFAACPADAGVPCPAADVVLLAEAEFSGNKITLTGWSVRR